MTKATFTSAWCIAFLLLIGVNSASAAEFTLEEHDEGINVMLDGKLFTNYVKLSDSKPILWPIIGPHGKPITRAYPMADAGEHERSDHKHHRSFWFTHGIVNGHDFWAEGGAKSGKIIHQAFKKQEGGETAQIVTINDWVGPDGKPVCKDHRTLTFGVDGDNRYIDFDIVIMAGEQEVTFGDTKEGTFGIRVAGSMKVDAKMGGTILNSEGDKDGATWAKQASWVDYVGPVEGEKVGIAILNHPNSFRYPTHWHVRTYGLFAANPFGINDFEPKQNKNGSHTLEPGKTMAFSYRVLIHKGDADIDEAFKRYAAMKK